MKDGLMMDFLNCWLLVVGWLVGCLPLLWGGSRALLHACIWAGFATCVYCDILDDLTRLGAREARSEKELDLLSMNNFLSFL